MKNTATSKTNGAATTAPLKIPLRMFAAPIEPETIRLPKAGQHDPYFGLTRSCLNSLVLPKAVNNFKPLVRSFVLRRRGARTGVRLVDFQSLKNYILADADGKRHRIKVECDNLTPIRIERAMEQLRQERGVFDQRKAQEARWFVLRLIMGYLSVTLLLAVVLLCRFILFNSQRFPEFTVQTAGAALFVDVLGLLIGVWKIVLKPDFMTKLAVETKEELPNAKKSRSSRSTCRCQSSLLTPAQQP
jgi:hypothetical protein